MWRTACREVQHLLQQRVKLVILDPPGVRILLGLSCPECGLFSTKRASYKQLRTFSSVLPLTQFRHASSTTPPPGGGSEMDKTPPGESSKSAGPNAEKTASESSPGGGGSEAKPKLLKLKVAKKKQPLEYSYSDNIYIMPLRAMNEYLLRPSDLDNLPKYSKRSPYDTQSRKITMFLRSDVEAVAKKVWGSLEHVSKEKEKKRRLEQVRYGKMDIFHIAALIEEQRASGLGEEKPYFITGEDEKGKKKPISSTKAFLTSGSGKVVVSAILINAFNSVIKCVAWLATGSHSMFSEFIHSVADTVNQLILGVGLYNSMKKPDPDHPYGYTNLRHISSLISGVGIFCFGTGLSWYHGIQGLMHPEEMGSLIWAIATMGGAMVSEGATLLVAIQEIRKSSRARRMSFWKYVVRGHDPNVNVVLLEDMVAVLGVGIAGVCMAVTQYTGSPFADSVGSILIGGLLGVVASFIIYTNSQSLVGRSIPLDVRLQISQELERDRMIRSLHDVKATEMGGQVRFKAEVDFDGREITRAYLNNLDMENLLAEIRSLQRPEDVEVFLLTHGEKIIDSLGEEVDRIEKVLKEKHPELRHVDLEAL